MRQLCAALARLTLGNVGLWGLQGTSQSLGVGIRVEGRRGEDSLLAFKPTNSYPEPKRETKLEQPGALGSTRRCSLPTGKRCFSTRSSKERWSSAKSVGLWVWAVWDSGDFRPFAAFTLSILCGPTALEALNSQMPKPTLSTATNAASLY